MTGAAAGKDPRDVAIEAAVEQAASLIVYVVLSLAIAGAITKRDAITRGWMRYRRWVRGDHKRARASREVAELRRDISTYEHEQVARERPQRVRGLYEQAP